MVVQRWQREYSDIDEDSFKFSQDYLKLRGWSVNPKKHIDDPRIGPHQDKEMNLMLANRKPVALVSALDYPFWEETIFKLRWIVVPRELQQDYVIGLPDQLWRAEKLVRITNTAIYPYRNEVHFARVGYLLGYTKECIKAFIDRKYNRNL